MAEGVDEVNPNSSDDAEYTETKWVITAVSASRFASTFLCGKKLLHYLNQKNIHKYSRSRPQAVN